MVWNTTQSALYEAEYDRRSPRAEERRAVPPRKGAQPKKCKSLFDDGDTLLLLLLLYILVKEKCDQTLIFSLLIAILL